jgi:hypothetical protein
MRESWPDRAAASTTGSGRPRKHELPPPIPGTQCVSCPVRHFCRICRRRAGCKGESRGPSRGMRALDSPRRRLPARFTGRRRARIVTGGRRRA